MRVAVRVVVSGAVRGGIVSVRGDRRAVRRGRGAVRVAVSGAVGGGLGAARVAVNGAVRRGDRRAFSRSRAAEELLVERLEEADELS